MVSYHDRWLISDAATVALQDLIDNPEKYDVGEFTKAEIYHCVSSWIKRFPGQPSVSYPTGKKVLYQKLDVRIERRILDVSRQPSFDADDVLRASVDDG